MKKLSSLDLKAVYVGPDQDPLVLQNIEQGNFMQVCISPELTIATDRNMLKYATQPHLSRKTHWSCSLCNRMRYLEQQGITFGILHLVFMIE